MVMMMQTTFAVPSTPFGGPVFLNRGPAGSPPQQDATDTLEALGAIQTVSPGVAVFSEGDQAGSWYRLQSGVLRTCKLLSDGRRQIDGFLFAGDFFGLDTGRERDLSAEAVTAANVIRYSRARIESLAGSDPRLANRLLGVALRQLGKGNRRSLLLGRKTAEEKLATFLLEMSERLDGRDAIELVMSRIDIADYLGLTIETVSRTFSMLKQQALIGLPTPHLVVIRDRGALEMLAGDSS
jgi:CRP/FNR family nitrogen fixation transcriptional regulator